MIGVARVAHDPNGLAGFGILNARINHTCHCLLKKGH